MSPTPRVAALLRAGRAERPPEGNEERVLTALGVGTGVASGVSLAGIEARTWLRWMGLGLVIGAISIPSAWAIGARRARQGQDMEVPRGGTIDRDDRLAFAPVTLGGRALAEQAASTPRVVSGRTLVTSPPIATASADDELARIRDARAAVQRGDAGAALSILEEHARAFPRGVFHQEAAALRVDALVAAGRLVDGRRAAFDATYPHSPYGPRLRRELDAPRGTRSQ